MVKPVELQDNLSKTQLLEKIQQLQKSTPEEAQKQFVHELQKKVAEGKERVTDTPKSDKIIIHREDKKKDRQNKPKHENAEATPEQKDDAADKNEKKESNKKIDYIA